MPQPRVHPQRIAWDGARAFVQAAADPVWAGWLRDRLGAHAGFDFRQYLLDSRDRLLASRRTDAIAVETSVWRVRLDDLLRAEPELTGALTQLIRETEDHLRGAV